MLDIYTRKMGVISSILPCDFFRFRGIINISQNADFQEGDGSMFQVGDQVLYGIHGVCKILEMQVQTVNRKKVEYYVLEPVSQIGSRYFVPSQNQVAASKLRPILSKAEIEELLSGEASRQNCWIQDENQRKQYYKELITSGDRAALISMLRALYQHKEQQMETGKKFHISDANFMRDAEKVIYSEFSMVLDIPYDQIEKYIWK